MNYAAQEGNEISAPAPASVDSISFSKRLRDALEALDVNEAITLRTKEDRQSVTNAVLTTKKKVGYKLSTRLVQKRDDEGRIVIEITRTA